MAVREMMGFLWKWCPHHRCLHLVKEFSISETKPDGFQPYCDLALKERLAGLPEHVTPRITEIPQEVWERIAKHPKVIAIAARDRLEQFLKTSPNAEKRRRAKAARSRSTRKPRRNSREA